MASSGLALGSCSEKSSSSWLSMGMVTLRCPNPCGMTTKPMRHGHKGSFTSVACVVGDCEDWLMFFWGINTTARQHGPIDAT